MRLRSVNTTGKLKHHILESMERDGTADFEDKLKCSNLHPQGSLEVRGYLIEIYKWMDGFV